MEQNKKASDIAKEQISRMLGISYEEFDLLDYDEQQALIKAYREKHPTPENELVTVMIGSGDSAIFVKMPKGEKYLLADGTVVEAGLTAEEQDRRLAAYFDKKMPKENPVKKLLKRFVK